MKQLIPYNINIIDFYGLLGASNSDYVSAIFELIDNAYSAPNNNQDRINVKIKILGDWQSNNLILENTKLIIEDDGRGIPYDNLRDVFTPGKKSINPGLLNQFGSGFKNAIMTLGCRSNNNSIDGFELISKTKNNEPWKVNKLLAGGILPINDKDHPSFLNKDSGTIITISYLKNFPKKIEHFKHLRTKLGVRYQDFINNNPNKFKNLNITLSLEDKDGVVISTNNGNKCFYEIKAISPLLSNDLPMDTKRFTSGTGNKWTATVFTGFRPSSEQFKSFDKDNEDTCEQGSLTSHPYHYRNKKIDIKYKGIIITQIPEHEIFDVSKETNDASDRANYRYILVDLEKGFELINTKNGIKNSDSFNELKAKIKEYFSDKKLKMNDNKVTEAQICDNMEKIFVDQFGKNNVEREPTLIFGKRPDFIINGNILIEVKKDEIETNDIMQSVNYAILSGLKSEKIRLYGPLTNNPNVKNCASNYLKDLIKAARSLDVNEDIEVEMVDVRPYIPVAQ